MALQNTRISSAIVATGHWGGRKLHQAPEGIQYIYVLSICLSISRLKLFHAAVSLVIHIQIYKVTGLNVLSEVEIQSLIIYMDRS